MRDTTGQAAPIMDPLLMSYYHGTLHFLFSHSMRIPDQHVSVDLYGRAQGSNDPVEVRAISKPMYMKGWEQSYRDTTFFLPKETYDRLNEIVGDIEVPSANEINALAAGSDGYTCTIEYGGYGHSVSLTVWQPEEGKPPGSYKACRAMLMPGGFDPDKILE